jgi:hypothetical protein
VGGDGGDSGCDQFRFHQISFWEGEHAQGQSGPRAQKIIIYG